MNGEPKHFCCVCYAAYEYTLATHTCVYCKRSFCSRHYAVHEAIWAGYHILRSQERLSNGNNEGLHTRS